MILEGDCLDRMREMEADSVDAVVTDPPAGISMMNAEWDSDKGSRNNWIAWLTEVMEEAHRVMKPGAHGLVWALPRTSHWTAMALEDAGFDVRDRISHVFGTGFPKSADVSKAIDKLAGAEREVVGSKLGQPGYSLNPNPGHGVGMSGNVDGSLRNPEAECAITAPATDEARKWEGFGTALKPACEDFWLVVKPESIAWHCSIMIQTIGELESELCRLIAKIAGESSKPTPRLLNEGKDASVPASAAINTEAEAENRTETGEAGATSSEADISASTSAAASIALNMLSSWKSILEEASGLANKSTTETVSGLITDFKTLRSLISQTTPEYMLQAASNQNGSPSPVPYAAAVLSGLEVKLSYIQTQFAPESVLGRKPANEQNGFQPDANATSVVASSKPSTEDWWLIRKPLSESSIARNVLRHGTGAINVGASRIGNGGQLKWEKPRDMGYHKGTDNGSCQAQASTSGRFPANLLISHGPECRRIGEKRIRSGKAQRQNQTASHFGNAGAPQPDLTYADPDGKEIVEDWECTDSCPVAEMDRQSGNVGGRWGKPSGAFVAWFGTRKVHGGESQERRIGDTKGGASRFFQTFEPDTGAGFRYQSKASKRDRSSNGAVENIHPTTKSTSLMSYLVRMVTPPGGTVLDPFAGSGSTLVAAVQEGFDCIGIEAEPEYADIARRRIAHCNKEDSHKLF